MNPRRRKALRWYGTAASALLLALWLGSGKRAITWTPTSTIRLAVAAGCLRFERHPTAWPDRVRGLQVQSNYYNPYQLIWDPWMHRSPVGTIPRPYFFPLWPITAAILLPTLALWFFDIRAFLRARAGLCTHCTYSLAGLSPDARCPECGALPTTLTAPLPAPEGRANVARDEVGASPTKPLEITSNIATAPAGADDAPREVPR